MITKLLQLFAVNSSRIHLEKFNRYFAERVPSGALVLDAGAGEAPYRDFFSHTRYESADFEAVDKVYSENTYVCDLKDIPVEDARFDFVLLNQVLEHLSEPHLVLRELGRVLKPGGRLLCTAPLFYEEHETPYDFYRYTQFAYPVLFEPAGFRVDEIEWMEGYFGTVAYQLEAAAKYLPIRPADISSGWVGFAASPIVAVSKIVFLFLAILFYRLDVISPCKTVGFPKNYAVLVTKMSQPV